MQAKAHEKQLDYMLDILEDEQQNTSGWKKASGP